MYDVRQFRPMMYALLLLGFTGYGIAAETPGLWLLAVSGTLLNAYLVRRDKFRPLPRVVANGVTLMFAAWMIVRVKTMGPPIFAIGEFLTFLQLVKLYEQRGNRDIAQLLVLSLLLMVAAAISTGSMLFGLAFLAYLFLSLYCCLLFHLKAESDHARQVTGLDESKINPMTLRQDQRFLSRSMRRLTGVVSAFAITAALLVFLLFPRGSGAGMIGSASFHPAQAMTGFNDQVSFQDVARITQNEAQVAWVTITKNGQPWGGPGQTIYLRGSAPDTYVGNPEDKAERWQWKRTTTNSQPGDLPAKPADDAVGDQYQQDIRLLPTGSRTLFAMPGLLSFKTNRDLKPTRGGTDDVLTTFEPGTSELSYTVVSTNTDAIPFHDGGGGQGGTVMGDTPLYYPIAPEVRDFATRDDVAGKDDKGDNLAQQRLKLRNVTDLDAKIAKNFEAYLRTNFKYTLDLTDARLVADKDPLVQFLTDFKRGHCEYFAGAMALMCQSVNMKARVVVGFKCDDFNSLGGYYVVRQSHAHAWVEVLTRNGWQRFDPTSSTEAGGGSHAQTVWQRVRSAMNFLEYKWGNSVVNYDSDSQTNIIQTTENRLSTTAMTTSNWLQDTKDQLRQWVLHLLGSDNGQDTAFGLGDFYSVLTTLITITIIVTSIGLVIFVLTRLRLYRRARRIGLDALPNPDQRRLARQLAFYDQMLQALERRKIVRGEHMTPREFGMSLGYLPAEAYSIVQGLTRVFYRVRFGATELQPSQQRRLARSVERIDTLLGA